MTTTVRCQNEMFPRHDLALSAYVEYSVAVKLHADYFGQFRFSNQHPGSAF
jgi:hypothetical protein